MRKRLFSLLVVAGACVVAPARADDPAAAQTLFDQGRKLVQAGRFSEACPKFKESLRLSPGLGTMLWLADCLENNGQTASAWAQFKDAAAAAALKNDDREKVARSRAAALEPKLTKLTIVVSKDAPAGLEVHRDDSVVGAAEWGVAVPVDPGPHDVSASAPGRMPWSVHQVLAPRPETTSVTVPALDAAPVAVVPEPERKPSPTPAPAESAPSTSTQKIVGLGLAGLGVVSLGIGTYFSFHAKSTYDDSNTGGHCLPSNVCDPTGRERRNTASDQATVATITMGLGAAALVGGVVLYLLAPKARAAASQLARMTFAF